MQVSCKLLSVTELIKLTMWSVGKKRLKAEVLLVGDAWFYTVVLFDKTPLP